MTAETEYAKLDIFQPQHNEKIQQRTFWVGWANYAKCCHVDIGLWITSTDIQSCKCNKRMMFVLSSVSLCIILIVLLKWWLNLICYQESTWLCVQHKNYYLLWSSSIKCNFTTSAHLVDHLLNVAERETTVFSFIFYSVWLYLSKLYVVDMIQ